MVHWLAMARLLPLGALVLGWLAAAGPVAAFQAEVARYHLAVTDICRTGVTPEILRAYETARLAVERARYGGGRESNFWGLKTPEGFWLDCLQAPDGKT